MQFLPLGLFTESDVFASHEAKLTSDFNAGKFTMFWPLFCKWPVFVNGNGIFCVIWEREVILLSLGGPVF